MRLWREGWRWCAPPRRACARKRTFLWMGVILVGSVRCHGRLVRVGALPHFLADHSPNPDLAKFIQERLDLSNTQARRLAAGSNEPAICLIMRYSRADVIVFSIWRIRHFTSSSLS